MLPRRDFRAKKRVTVVQFKGGKAVKKSKRSVPLRYAVDEASTSASSMASSSGDVVAEDNFFDDTDDMQEIEETPQRKPKIRRIRLKKKLQAYRERKARVAASWVDIRQGLVSALLYRQALQEGQKCVIPSCGKDAFGRCLHCGPGQFLCEEHIETVHAGGRSLHYPEFWKDGRYLPYALHECIWTTPHNNDHGITGQHAIKVKFCEHEAEASTLVRNGFWPSSPKQPQVAFDQGFMMLLYFLFLECRVSLKNIYQALQWMAPSLSKVYVKDAYRILVGECFGEFRFLKSIIDNLSNFNDSFGAEHECPACPKENGNMYISIDALFGCVRKCSAGTSAKAANHGEKMFIEQGKVDLFLSSYNKKSTSRAIESCNQFQAGSKLRSKIKSTKLDETALFGAGCRHEVPLKFFSLKRGEEIGNAVFLLKWLKELVHEKGITVYFFYDIACVLDAHFRSTRQENVLDNVVVAIPAFHCYGHKVSCQVAYSGRRLEGFGLSDGEVMERLWSFLRPTAKITKEMTPSHRVDTLTDFLVHYAKKSISSIGERLCDHLKKAEQTRKETEDQLALLLRKLNETGAKVEVTTVEEWTKTEKESILQESTKATTKADHFAPAGYPEKLKQYYTVRTSLSECISGSDTWQILTTQLNRLDEELKKMENGGRRWPPNSETYLRFLRDQDDKRRRNLLLSMHSKCSERWFLLQLMKKYADGQAIAKKLCGQISKTTHSIQQLIKQYGQGEALIGCKYPQNIILQEALDITSSLWNILDDSSLLSRSVPYCIKRQIIDLHHLLKRCKEESDLIKEEIKRVETFYQRQLGFLASWSKQLAGCVDSHSRGLLSIVRSNHDELEAFSIHLQNLFAQQSNEREDSEAGVLIEITDGSDGGRLEEQHDNEGVDDERIDEDEDGDQDDNELEKESVLEDLRSILNAEYGSDDDSDTDHSDSDST